MLDWAWLVCGIQQGCLNLRTKPVSSGWKGTGGDEECTLKSPRGKLEIEVVEVMWARKATVMSTKDKKGEISAHINKGSRWKV